MRTEGCKNFAYSQGLCPAHGGGKPRTNSKIGSNAFESNAAEAKTNDVKQSQKLSQSSCNTNWRDTVEPPTLPTSKERPKLQTAKNSDAWHASDLPSLFRTAGNKHKRPIDANVKQEKIEVTVEREGKRAKLSTDHPCKSDDETVCKVRGCMHVVVSQGVCQKHVKCNRCRDDGCNNVATAGRFCWLHGPWKECEENGCTKKARVRGRCSKHGGKYLCRKEGCDKTMYMRGLCGKHLREQENPAAKPVKSGGRGRGRARVKKED